MSILNVNFRIALVISFAFIGNLSIAQAEDQYYRAQYVKAYCYVNSQANRIELIKFDDSGQNSLVYFNEMESCKRSLSSLDKDFCNTTSACSIVKSPDNQRL